MTGGLPRFRKPGGFAPQGLIETFLLFMLVMGVLHLALGNWGLGGSMLGALAALFLVSKHMEGQWRCKVGDQVHVDLGRHQGRHGVVVGTDEAKSMLKVQLSDAEYSEPVDIPHYHLTKQQVVQPSAEC